MERSLNFIKRRYCERKAIIIVGAGIRGKELLQQLKQDDSINIEVFFDNNEEIIGTYIDEIRIVKPCKYGAKGILYVIAVDLPENRRNLHSQLLAQGISTDDIITYFCNDYEYLENLEEKYYLEELQEMYSKQFGKKINWEHPVTYTEKINWEKLNIKDERRTRLADKFLVRDWVREQIGEKYLIKLYDVWDDVEEINFKALPDSFVLKLNNGSGRNIIVKDKAQIDQQQVCRKLKQWKETNYAYETFEFHYKDIIPKIICEEYLEGVADSVYDYNIYCFHGEPEYIHCIKGAHRQEGKASFYTKDWEMMPFSCGYPRDDTPAPKPAQLEEMLRLSRILSKDFKHVRVDWYDLPDGRVLFGEMTFASWAGLYKWEPEEYDTFLGNMI